MIIIYLGDTSEYLARIACSYDINAQLITEKTISNLKSGTYYTSLGDVNNLYNLGLVLQQADKIVFAPPPNDHWSGGTVMKRWTEDYLEIFSAYTSIENFEATVVKNQHTILSLSDVRKNDDLQLWISGCSISHGVGVDHDMSYGNLLARQLNLPVSFLTSPGASIPWSVDQILRSDIRPGDIVVLGLTSHLRLPYYHNDKVMHVNSSTYVESPNFEKILSIDTLTGKDTLYRSLTGIFQVINFCQHAQAKLIIASLMSDELVPYLKDLPNFIMLYKLWGRELTNMFADLGFDNQHPGPKTHQFYADEICKKLNFML
jgi:hypothetical protein